MAIRVTERSISSTGSSAFRSMRRATTSRGSAKTWASIVSASPTRSWRRRRCRPEWRASRAGTERPFQKPPSGGAGPACGGTLCGASSLCIRSHEIREDMHLNKTLISLLSGASALALLSGSQASAAPPVDEINVLRPARSFAELLDPIPNAENVLRAEDERAGAEERSMVVAEYYHHHHHYHHHY